MWQGLKASAGSTSLVVTSSRPPKNSWGFLDDTDDEGEDLEGNY
jgi:hypothetical protein